MQTFHIPRLLLVAFALLLTRTPDAVAQESTPLQEILDVAGSWNSTCAVTYGGGVKCWGSNDHGQLGDGSLVASGIPVNVVGLANGVLGLSMDSGGGFACASTSTGSAKCWGWNDNGQLGDGTTVSRSTPVTVSGLASGVVAISAGGVHACALTSVGGVKCWGWNLYGQLGDGTTTNRSTPVDVQGLGSGVVAIGSGGTHSCAIFSTGAMKCWGRNNAGQLGDGTTINRLAPVDVAGLSGGVMAMKGGRDHSCAITLSGGAKCWGDNGSGQLGIGSVIGHTVPVDVSGLASGVATIHVGGYFSCAVLTSNGIRCWGANSEGQMGTGRLETRYYTPTPIDGLQGARRALATGHYHLCAAMTNGRVKCAGSNANGQLGNGNPSLLLTSADVVGAGSGVAVVNNGYSFTCSVISGGAKCWGENRSGQLGDGSDTRRTSAVDVFGLTNGMHAVSAGTDHACALTAAGGVKCWGHNGSGQLGDGTSIQRYRPVDVFGLFSGVGSIAVGSSHTCALTSLGGVKCWGWNANGQLGDGTTSTRLTPVDVVGLTSGVIAIDVGESHACALTTAGGVKCWGYNVWGQLGDGSTSSSSIPINVTGMVSGVTSIRAGGFHTCALTTIGGVKCWGYNGTGALGDDTFTNRLIPVDVSGLATGTAAVGTGITHTCAAMMSGGAKCWGENLSGQLGDGTTVRRRTPVNVVGLTGGIAALTGGSKHTCALTTSGALKCWGDNMAGQLGLGGRDFTLFADVLAGNSIFASGFD